MRRFVQSLVSWHLIVVGLLSFGAGAQPQALAQRLSLSHASTATLPLKHAPRPTHAKISAADLMTRLYILADDSMQGRAAATPGNVRATAYLAAELAKLGLEPAGDSGTSFQTLTYEGSSQAP